MMNDLSAQVLKNNDIKGFENIFKQWYPALCRYAFTLLNSDELAEEMVQEVFYKLWKNRQQTDITTSLKAYLYRATQNECLQYLRHQKVEEKHRVTTEFNGSDFFSPEDAMIEGELYQIYKNTLDELPENCRKIFQLSRNEGMKYKDIAEKLSISIKTVEANISKALNAFKKNFAGHTQVSGI